MTDGEDERSHHQDMIQRQLEGAQPEGNGGDCMSIEKDVIMHETSDRPMQPMDPTNADKCHDQEAPESENARVERLGRERPAKFKSFGRELAFCYSVIASQFMAVSLPMHGNTLYLIADIL